MPPKRKTIKAFGVFKEDCLKSWYPLTPFTGALAIFEKKQQAIEAVIYNGKLVKIEKRKLDKYRVFPVEILLPSKPSKRK